MLARAMPDTIAQRFTLAFGGNDQEALRELDGHEPTGERGVMVETHAITIRDGRIVEQWVGDNSFQMPYMDLVTYGMDFPRDTPHPKPPIIEASVS
jgi:hypothetical protein